MFVQRVDQSTRFIVALTATFQFCDSRNKSGISLTIVLDAGLCASLPEQSLICHVNTFDVCCICQMYNMCVANVLPIDGHRQ